MAIFRCDSGFEAAGLNPLAAVGGYRLSYFVDPINGSDSNDGKSWNAPFLTPQAAVTQFIADKSTIYTGSALSPAAEIYGLNAVIFLGAGDYNPADDTHSIIDLPEYTADGATTGGAWGLTIMGVPGNSRAILMGGATNTKSLIKVNGCRGVRLLNLSFYRALQTASTADIELAESAGAAATQHFEIAGCKFLQDMVADAENSPCAILVSGAQLGSIHDNEFHPRGTARGIILQGSASFNPTQIEIHSNYFCGLASGGIQYVKTASIQELDVHDNVFRRNGVLPVAGANLMTNAVDILNAAAVQIRPAIHDNVFVGNYAGLDNVGANDALYNAQDGATVDAGVDYFGNDGSNILVA